MGRAFSSKLIITISYQTLNELICGNNLEEFFYMEFLIKSQNLFLIINQ